MVEKEVGRWSLWERLSSQRWWHRLASVLVIGMSDGSLRVLDRRCPVMITIRW